MDLRENFIRSNGVSLHVVEAGPHDGNMVIFLHGFPEFWYAWRKQIDYFAGRNYFVVVPDQRGYNLSDKPTGIASYKTDELARDIVGIMDHYGREQVFLVGHDLGAAVSWWTAIKYPERIKKLVIMNVPHPEVMSTNLLTNPKQMQKSWYVFFFQLPNFPERLGEANNYQWPLDVLSKTSQPGAFTPEELQQYRTAFAQPGAYTAMLNWYRASLQVHNAQPDSFRITMPTLVLWGARDVALALELAEQSMTYCDQGRLIVFKENTHWIQHEAAGQINPLIDEYLAD